MELNEFDLLAKGRQLLAEERLGMLGSRKTVY
jgi:hypothetical protein